MDGWAEDYRTPSGHNRVIYSPHASHGIIHIVFTQLYSVASLLKTLASLAKNSSYLEAARMERRQTFSQVEPIWRQTQREMIPWLPRQPHPPQRESGLVSCATCPERWNPV